MANLNGRSNGDDQLIKHSEGAGAETEARFFEIRVKGQLNNHWSEWLEGLEVRLVENGEMILYGYLVDQAALIGVLNKVSYLNLSLLSVNELNNVN